MKQVEKIIDCSTWMGQWPFVHLRYRTADELKKKLQSLHIVKAFTSPMEAILEQDPMRANKQLLNDTRNDPFFSPVLVVDLSFVNWEENVELAILDERVKMVKLIPNYHMYELNERRLEKLVGLTREHNLLISIQMRVEDLRGQHPLMKVNDVDVFQAVKVLSHFTEQTFILNNLYRNQVSQVLHSVENAYVDLASLEHADLLNFLKTDFPLERILFSSHSPFYFPEGNVFKLRYTDATMEEIEQVAYRNAQTLLSL